MTPLAEISGRLETMYAKRFGAENVVIIQSSNRVSFAGFLSLSILVILIFMYRIAERFCRRIFHNFAFKQTFCGINFTICMLIVHVCVLILTIS